MLLLLLLFFLHSSRSKLVEPPPPNPLLPAAASSFLFAVVYELSAVLFFSIYSAILPIHLICLLANAHPSNVLIFILSVGSVQNPQRHQQSAARAKASILHIYRCCLLLSRNTSRRSVLGI